MGTKFVNLDEEGYRISKRGNKGYMLGTSESRQEKIEREKRGRSWVNANFFTLLNFTFYV